MNPGNCLFSDTGKLGIRRDHLHRLIKMKFCMGDGLQEVDSNFIKIDQAVSELWGQNLPFSIDLAIGLYEIVI